METTQMFISWQMVKQNVVYLFVVVIVQLLSCIWFFVTPWIAARQAPLSFTISQSLLKHRSIELVMLSNHIAY